MDENDTSWGLSSFGRLHVRMQRYRPSDLAITITRRLPQRHLARPRLSFLGNGYWSSNVTSRRDSTTPGLQQQQQHAFACVCVFTGVKVLVNVSFRWASSSRRDTYLGEGGGLESWGGGGVPICISDDQNKRNDSEINVGELFLHPKTVLFFSPKHNSRRDSRIRFFRFCLQLYLLELDNHLNK